jgi:hypothetical protein
MKTAGGHSPGRKNLLGKWPLPASEALMKPRLVELFYFFLDVMSIEIYSAYMYMG